MHYLISILLLLFSFELIGQTIDPAPSLELPDLSKSRLRDRSVEVWPLPGYAIEYSNLYFGIASTSTSKRVFLKRYAESNQAQGIVTLQGEKNASVADGPASFLVPDGRFYRGGAFRQNQAHGPWISVSIDTVLAEGCPEFRFDTPYEKVESILRNCYSDTLIQHRIKVSRANYVAGQLEGEAEVRSLGGLVFRTMFYESGKPIGEEVSYNGKGIKKYTVEHGRASSDTTFTAYALVDTLEPQKSVEYMPAFMSEECPVPDFENSKKAEMENYKACTSREMIKFVYRNVRYPESSIEEDIQGMSVVTFIVEKDGTLSDIHTVRFVSAAIDQEALRVVRSMPAWRAGMQEGKPVRVRFNLPIKFSLQ